MAKEFYIAGGLFAAAAAGSLYWYYHYVQAQTTLSFTPTDGAAGTSATDTDSTAGNLEANVTAALAGWKNVGNASDWLPTLAQVESSYGFPADLLARIAYEESHFREEIIRGTKASSAGALGLMQLEPEYYPSVRVPIPFSDSDVIAQINDAAVEMQHLYGRFGSWSLALAGYNAGEGEVHEYNGIPPFPETQKYVSEIVADVPALA